ncbi:MAG: hypothetical protein SF052_18230 [Bacteroidia bacterium]|nr:hypothetical protein [Bacteroidia bacterium]
MKRCVLYPAIMGMVAGFLFSSILYAQTTYRLTENNHALRVEKSSLPSIGTLKIFASDTLPSVSAGIPPMLGKTEEEGDSVEFIPTFPFRRGVTYSAAWGEMFLFRFQIPVAEKLPAPELIALYPSAHKVPANLLKIYLHFSVPMREGVAMNYVFLLDEKGDTLPGAFLDLQPELWDFSGKRLTIWFDPGRIKRDLGPNQLLGAPLTRGGKYTLLVSQNWPDIHGNIVRQDFRKKIQVTAPDRKQPEVHSWEILPPDPQTQEPLIIKLGENMDHALLSQCFTIFSGEKSPVSGKVIVEENESLWKFVPDLPWKRDRYEIQVETRLEDLAGNNLNRPFDRDIRTHPGEWEDKTFFTLEFEIRD